MDTLFHETDLHDKSFLVTGGAGFIGSHLAEYLLKHGARRVRVLDNMANGFQANLDVLRGYPAFEFIEGDIRNLDTCRAACRDMDLVSHQAALGSVPRSVREPFTTNDVNVGGFVNMLSAAVDRQVSRFVYASSSSVYGDETSLPKKEALTGNCLSPYAVSKKANELYAEVFAKTYALPVIGLRYFNIFGPRQDPDGPYAAVIPLFIRAILKGSPAGINGDGGQTRDFTYVENAVQANVRGLLVEREDALNTVYNVAVGESCSVNELYDAIRRHLRSDVAPVHRQARAGDVRDSLADISRARNLLGYEPTVRFEIGLLRTIEYFKKLYVPDSIKA